MSCTPDHPTGTVTHTADGLHLSNGTDVLFAGGNRLVAYTVGLAALGLPELLIAGLAPPYAHTLLQVAVHEAVHGCPPMPGDRITFPDELVGEWVSIDHPDVHLKSAVVASREAVSALQMVWSDPKGRWPWDIAFADGRGGQPVLGIRAADGWFDDWAEAG